MTNKEYEQLTSELKKNHSKGYNCSFMSEKEWEHLTKDQQNDWINYWISKEKWSGHIT